MDISTATRDELLNYIAQLENNITKLQEERETDRFLLEMFQHVPVATLMVDTTSGQILDHNATTYTMFGYPADALIGRQLQSLMYEDNTAYDMLLRPDLRTDWQGELQAKRADGSAFWCHVAATSQYHPEHGDVVILMFHDIDERMRASLSTLKSEALYLSLVDTLPQFLYRTNLDGVILFINESLQAFLDMKFTDVIGKPAQAVLRPFTASRVVVDDSDVIKTVQRRHATTSITHPETLETMYITVIKTPVLDEFGEISAVQTIIEDTTQRTLTLQELKSSRRALSRLIQQIPIGIQVFDMNGTCIEVNEAHEQIFGRSREQLVSKFNLFADEMAKEQETYLAARRALAGETVNIGDIEFDFSRADERFASIIQGIRIINVTIFPTVDHSGTVTGFVGLNIDVTERKRREKRLQLSEARYRAVVEDQPEMLSRYLPDGQLTFVNQAYCDLVGMTEDELIGMRWQDLVTDDIVAISEANLLTVTPEHPSTFHDEEKIMPDGSSRWIQWINRAIFNNEGELVEYQGLGIDITEKKEIEERQFKLALEQERVKLLGDFVIRASHEFRTPLSIINSSASIIARQPDPDLRLRRLDKINRQVDLISQLVDSMTIMSRLDRDLLDHEMEIVDANRMIEIACTRLRGKRTATSPAITCITDSPPIKIRVLEKDFVYVLELLGDNALKFSGADDQLTMQATIVEERAIITVQDTGIGMDDATLEKAFNRFYRADEQGTTSGLGLGLPIARAIILQFDGDITLASTPGKGTTVTVSLPLLNR